jgi:hypothetical protein
MREIKLRVTNKTDDCIALISNCYKSDQWLIHEIKSSIEKHLEKIRRFEKNGISFAIDKRMRKLLD